MMACDLRCSICLLLSKTLPLSLRRRSGGNEPRLSLDFIPPPRKKKQKETSPPLGNQVAAGDPNLGSRLEHAIEMRAQQVQQQVLKEQTPVKEHIECDHPDEESAQGSSSVDGNSAQESAKGSGSNPIVLSPSSTVKENPEVTNPKRGHLEDEQADGDDGITTDEYKESAKGSVSLPLEDAKGSGSALMASNSVAAPNSAASAQESSSVHNVELPSVPRDRGSAADKAQWAEFLTGAALTTQNASSARTPSPSARESHTRENSTLRASSSAKVDEPSGAKLSPWTDSNVVEPRFALTPDLRAAIDQLQLEGIEEVMPEQFFMGHFKVLFEEGKFNTIEDVKAAYVRVYGTDECALSADFVDELTLNLFKCSDPFNAIAHNFASKQNAMLEEKRNLHRENMKRYQKELKEQFSKDLVEMSKSMNDIHVEKVQELNSLKIAHRHLSIAHTVLESNHALLAIKSAAQSGTEGYAQLQKEVKELQAKLKVKEDESELNENQCIRLTEAFMRQGMNPPAEVPVDAPAPAPADDYGWGPDPVAKEVHNNR
jgi:hypothetical protein